MLSIVSLTLPRYASIPTVSSTKSSTFAKSATFARRSFSSKSRPSSFTTGASRSEEHTSELQSHRDLHSFPTRRSSDPNREFHQIEHLRKERDLRPQVV